MDELVPNPHSCATGAVESVSVNRVLVTAATVVAATVAASGCGIGINTSQSPPVAVSPAASEADFAAEFTEIMTGTELSSSPDPSEATAQAVQLAMTYCRLFASGDTSPTRTPADNAAYLDGLVRRLQASFPVTDDRIRQGLIAQARFECPDYVDMLTAYDQWAATR